MIIASVERAARGVYAVRPGVTGLAQVHEIDMSTPRLLAQVDALMVARLDLRFYVRFVLRTALGGGAGDRVRE